jgi:hypothetical protein
MEELDDLIKAFIEQNWDISQEVSGNGDLVNRAVSRDGVREMIHIEDGPVFELFRN